MLKKNRGFTLLELIITIAIISLMLTAVISLMPLVTQINNAANDLTEAQTLAQLKMKVIENELRYANNIDIEASLPETLNDESVYLCLNSGKLNFVTKDSSARAISSDQGFEEYTYDISFTPANGKVLKTDLKLYKNGKQIYSLKSEVLINNLISENITGAATGKCIAYKLEGVSITQIIVTSVGSSIDTSGQTLQMNADIYPTNATNKGVAWSVDSGALASITQAGVLTPLGNGTVTVKATALDGSGTYGVKQIIISNQFITITSLGLHTETGQNELLKGGYSLAIIPDILPSNATNKALTWSVDNTNYATIDQNGVLTSKSFQGKKSVIVRAATKDGSNITATIEIKLKS